MKALLVVDIQNDFLPGGSLAVPESDKIIPVLNRLMERFPLAVATTDWHPKNHASFASNHPGHEIFDEIDLDGVTQKLWPDHCVQGTPGAEFPKELNANPFAAIFRKGSDPKVDSYSGFFDNRRAHQTGLTGYLKGLGVKQLYIAGLAAEICVSFSAADGIEQGFETAIIEDACEALDPESYARKKEELQKEGVRFVQSTELIEELKR